MRRKWLLIGVGVSVLCVVGILPVLAQGPGPGRNPLFATVEYVDERVAELYQYIDEQIAAVYAYVDEQIAEVGGGGGPDFDLPGPGEMWYDCFTRQVDEYRTAPVLWIGVWNPVRSCSWHGVEIWDKPGGWGVDTRAIVSYNGDPLGYGFGNCITMDFRGLTYLPDIGETVDVDIWYYWMGKEKHTATAITVTSEPPECSLSANADHGSAPLPVTFTATTSDPEGDEIVEYRWDFGDGTVVVEGSQSEVHTFTTHSKWPYYVDLWIIDDTGANGGCSFEVTVDPPQE